MQMIHEDIIQKVQKLVELRCRRDTFAFLENVMGSPSAKLSLIEIRREIRQTWRELQALRLMQPREARVRTVVAPVFSAGLQAPTA